VLAYLRALESNDELMIHRLKSLGFDAHQVAGILSITFLAMPFSTESFMLISIQPT